MPIISADVSETHNTLETFRHSQHKKKKKKKHSRKTENKLYGCLNDESYIQTTETETGTNIVYQEHSTNGRSKRKTREESSTENISGNLQNANNSIEAKVVGHELSYNNFINEPVSTQTNTTNEIGNSLQETADTIMMKQRHSFRNKVLPDVQNGDSLHRKKHKKKKRRKIETELERETVFK